MIARVCEVCDCSVCYRWQSPECFSLCIFCGAKVEYLWDSGACGAVRILYVRHVPMEDGATFSGEPSRFHPEKPSALLWFFHLVLVEGMSLQSATEVSRGNVRSNCFWITVFWSHAQITLFSEKRPIYPLRYSRQFTENTQKCIGVND